MSNQFGYNQQYADKPGMWDVDGYAVCIDHVGTLAVVLNRVQTTGVLAAVQQLAPSSAVHDITQTASSSGIYKIHLNQTWVQLQDAHVSSVIPSPLSPAYLGVQQNLDTVGNTSYGPGQSELQFVQFTVNNAGTPTPLPFGAGIRFRLRLSNVST
jgi:hypothetical protein